MAKAGSKHTAVQMEERKPTTEEGHDLEEPFDENFWLKVSCLDVISMQITHARQDNQFAFVFIYKT